MFVDKLPTWSRAPSFPGFLGVWIWLWGLSVSSEICLILRGFWLPVVPRQTCLPLPSWEGRGEPSAWELMKVSARPGMQLWEPEREWWRETKSSCHKLACHHVPGASVTPASSSLPTSASASTSRASALAGRLGRAPLLASSHRCGGEPLWSALPAPRVASQALPSLCLSNQSSQFARAQFFIVFFTPTGQAAPAWLSGFCFLVDLVWSPLKGVFCLGLQEALSMISR